MKSPLRPMAASLLVPFFLAIPAFCSIADQAPHLEQEQDQPRASYQILDPSDPAIQAGFHSSLFNESVVLPTPNGEALPAINDLTPSDGGKSWAADIGLAVSGAKFVLRPLESEPFALLIIADSSFVDDLTPLKSHKDASGIATRIYSWQDLDARYASQGRDQPERLKMAIADFRRNNFISYVMLVGDSDRLPVRYCKTYDPNYWGNSYIPSDLYYADLFKWHGGFDNWDADNDGRFCELQFGVYTTKGSDINLDQMDLYPDVAVGRVPASTAAEVRTYVSKVISYEYQAYNADWASKAALIVPGYLNADGVTYDDYPTAWESSEKIASDLAVAGITSSKLYDNRISDLTVGGTIQPTTANIRNALNNGVGFVSFAGHGGSSNWWDMFFNANVDALTNSLRLPVIFAAACDTARFHFDDDFYKTDGVVFDIKANCPKYDGAHRCWPVNPSASEMPEPRAVQRVGSNTRDADSLAERFLVRNNGGAVAYIGSYTGSQTGAEILDHYFFERYKWSASPILGPVWNWTLKSYIGKDGFANQPGSANWVPGAMYMHIFKMMLFGDPSLRLDGILPRVIELPNYLIPFDPKLPDFTQIVLPLKPDVVSAGVEDIGQTTARLTGKVNPRGGITQYRFGWGLTTFYSDFTDWQTIGNGTEQVDVSAVIKDLPPDQNLYYFLRAESVFGGDSSTGMNFHTLPADTGISEHTGWWYTPDKGGTGVSLKISGNQLFMAWYNYDDSGRPRWYTSSGIMQDNGRYSGDVLEFTGWPWGQTYGAPSSDVVGQVGLVFKDGDPVSLEMSWNIGGKSGAATLVDFMDDVAPGAADSRGLTDWWWAPELSGMGIFLQAQGGQLFMAWYNYRGDNSSNWWTVSGAFPDGAASFTGSLRGWSGGQCLGCPYTAPGSSALAGSFQLSFTDADHAVLTWGGNTVNLERFSF